MSTRTCPFCAEEIQAAAVKCRYCSSRVEPVPEVPEVPQQVQVPRVHRWAEHHPYLSAVIIIAILAGVLGLFSLGSDDDYQGTDPNDGNTSSGAKNVCENSVKDHLKAPATAKFSGAVASPTGEGWMVTGSVDSENGFGALVRNTYTCDAKHQGGNNWLTKSTLLGGG